MLVDAKKAEAASWISFARRSLTASARGPFSCRAGRRGL